ARIAFAHERLVRRAGKRHDRPRTHKARGHDDRVTRRLYLVGWRIRGREGVGAPRQRRGRQQPGHHEGGGGERGAEGHAPIPAPRTDARLAVQRFGGIWNTPRPGGGEATAVASVTTGAPAIQ